MTPDPLAALLPDLTRLARILDTSGDTAQDLVQETVLRLLRRAGTLDEIDDLPGYARTVLRNLYRRSHGAVREHPTDTLPDEGVPPEVFPVLALRDIVLAIETLPPDQAQVLRIVLEGETSPRRIALRTGVPAGTVMSRLARARAHLRRRMELAPDDKVSNLF